MPSSGSLLPVDAQADSVSAQKTAKNKRLVEVCMQIPVVVIVALVFAAKRRLIKPNFN